jgi:ComF family protein
VKTVLSVVQIAYMGLLDLLFPEECIACGKASHALCDSCAQNLKNSKDLTPVPIFALYDYKDPIVKKAIWHMKYHRRSHLGKTLGQLLYRGYIEEIADIRIHTLGRSILVVPIPLSRMRYKERGYNQALKIAQGFCDADTERIFEVKKNIIVKNTDTVPQAQINNRARRLKNITGAFTVTNTKSVMGRTIIVIDDVTTTGGTMNEVIRMLEKSGAKKVYGLAVAH